MLQIDRRRFLFDASFATVGVSMLAGAPVSAQSIENVDGALLHPEFPRQPADLAREVVGAAHRDLDKVKSLVDEHPSLCNAAWDWGFGDWETPLGAASHVGQPEIAKYLIRKGARVDIFCAAMLGWLDVIKAMLSADPSLAATHGPHGITLLAHAKAGGEQAQAVVQFLSELGTADPVQTSLPLSEDLRNSYHGAYAIERSQFRFEILNTRQGNLGFKPVEGSVLMLFRTGEHEFHPAGARAVRLRFELESGSAKAVTIQDGRIQLRAQRI